MKPLDHKRLVITGAASGIGRATSLLAAAEGAYVVAVDLADGVLETVREIRTTGGNAVAMQADVSDENAIAGCIDRCLSEFGGLDGVYANAGIGGAGKPFADMTAADWQRTLAVNTIGVFLAFKQAIPHLTRQGSGALLATASVAGLRANAGGVDYSASKAAVAALTRATALYCRKNGLAIRVNSLHPDGIYTPMMKATAPGVPEKYLLFDPKVNPKGRAIMPEHIAKVLLFLASDDSVAISGAEIKADSAILGMGL